MIKTSPPRSIPDRPSKYLTVPLDGDLTLHFRLPNEKRQMELLRFVAARVRGGTSLQVVADLDALAAVVGVCWFHPTLDLETPLPWAATDAARRSLQESSGDSGGPLTPSDDPGALSGAPEPWDAVLLEYGEKVLDELDEEGFGGRNEIGVCFGAITQAIGRSFIPQEVIDSRLGFTAALLASSD